MPERDRLDQAMVARGLADSRARAQALIGEGAVTVNGAISPKASRKVTGEDRIAITGPVNPYVSRAALKLVHGLERFDVDPAGQTALDLGASTGGFTEVLLGRGAKEVWAVDVGHGQLHPRLSADPRVINCERTHIRDFGGPEVPRFGLIVSDVSFISLTKALPNALAHGAAGADLIALVKPQFEVGRAEVGKGGIVRDADARDRAVADVAAFLSAAGWSVLARCESPITGGDGNVEFLIHARGPGSLSGVSPRRGRILPRR